VRRAALYSKRREVQCATQEDEEFSDFRYWEVRAIMIERQMPSAQRWKEDNSMDEAGVVINLKEGIVDLQGPADFVQHCLDMYGPAILGLQGLPQHVAATPEKARLLRRKRKVAPVTRSDRAGRGSYAGAIRSDLEAGFFDRPRSTGEIKQRLSEAGLTFTDSGVRANLRRLTLDGLLDAVKKGRLVRYQRRSPR